MRGIGIDVSSLSREGRRKFNLYRQSRMEGARWRDDWNDGLNGGGGGAVGR